MWQTLTTINPSGKWQLTEPVEGQFFRLAHTTSDLPTEYFRAELAQVELDEQGKYVIFDVQEIEASPEAQVIELPKPACFSNRRIAIRALRDEVQLPPFGRPYSWAIGIENFVTSSSGDGGNEPPPPPVRQTTKDKLTYTPTALEAYSYFDANFTISRINDGNTSEGAITGGTQTFRFKVTFDAPRVLNEIRVFRGQFNGNYNMPNRMMVYAGENDTSPLVLTVEGEAMNVWPGAVIADVSTNANFEPARTEYCFVFDQSGTSRISINELELYGY